MLIEDKITCPRKSTIIAAGFLGAAAMTVAGSQLILLALHPRNPAPQIRQICPGQAGREHIVCPAEADRCRRAECRICRRRPRRWPRGHSAARLAIRHPHLCRCRAAAGVGGLPGDRAVSARLRHDALSLERDGPQRPAVGDRARHHRLDGRAQDRKGDHRRLSTGVRARPASSRRSGRSAARPWSRSAAI